MSRAVASQELRPGSPSRGGRGLDPPLNSQIASYLRRLAAAGEPRTPELTPAAARARVRRARRVQVPTPAMRAVEEIVAPGPGGELPCRLYRPDDTTDMLIVFFHGGGWVLGDLETADGSARRLAHAAGADVLSVDYRLAPEHPFPAAVRDAQAVVPWAGERLAGGRPLVVAGDSAGGTLATVCAIGRRRLGVSIAAQLLAYPVLDCDLDRPSYQGCCEILPLRREEMAWYWEHYLPDPRLRLDPEASPLRAADLGGAPPTSEASPLRAADLGGAPPTVLVQAGHDPLLEEGREYAQALERAQVAVRRLEYGAAVHGFLALAGDFVIRDRALAEASRALRELVFEGLAP